MDELEALRRYTRRTANEASFTFCKRPHKPDKLYIGADFEGDNLGTPIGDCEEKYGTGTKVGDAHSHPIGSDSIGITPSNEDILGSMEDAYIDGQPDINCITAPGADIVHCMQPKKAPSEKKLKGYRNIPKSGLNQNPYVMDNFTTDFTVGLFDAKSGDIIENPDPKRVVDNAMGKSSRFLRKAIREMEYGKLCEYIQDVMIPDAKDDRVHNICKAELKKRGLLDYLGIY